MPGEHQAKATTHTATVDEVVAIAPGLAQRDYVGPLADAYRRLDPTQDGWETEAFHERATGQLKHLAHFLEDAESATQEHLVSVVAQEFSTSGLRPAARQTRFADGNFVVERFESPGEMGGDTHHGLAGFGNAVQEFAALFQGMEEVHAKLKLYRVVPLEDRVETRVRCEASAHGVEGSRQVTATWKCDWVLPAQGPPLLSRVSVLQHDEVSYRGERSTLFVDDTQAILGKEPVYREQLLYSTDHWRSRIPRDLGLDVVANHGLAIGDVNGDGLDDLYLCQQGGIPNRLLLRTADGTLRDASAASGADWMEYCASALLIDLDNDGDRDLVVAREWRINFMSNDGRGHFTLQASVPSQAQTFSLSAADFDRDGDLDVFTCGYNPSAFTVRSGAMGEPMPYHDANNGGKNMLLRNEGEWNWRDVTVETGLDENNTRYSFAAAWEDYDNDGDLDLYVANDYGRNNLYRQDKGRFRDVAAELQVEDASSGMSTAWGDYNNDGWMDLYISNMFSAAGNRITYQRQFKENVDEQVRAQFQRHARGNALFENDGQGGFRDVSVSAGVTMGRWAWGSNFVDFNQDGWLDLVVANGFITTEDTGDL